MGKLFFVFLLGIGLLGCQKESQQPIFLVLPEDMNAKANPLDGSVTLAWQPYANWLHRTSVIGTPIIVGLLRVEVFQSVGDTTRFELISTLAGNATTLTVPNLPNGELHYFKVIGYLPDNAKGKSSIVEVVATVPNHLAEPQMVLKADFFRYSTLLHYFKSYAIAPDYRRIALNYVTSTGSIVHSLWLYDPEKRTTTFARDQGYLPAWSPSGAQIATAGGSDGPLNVYEISDGTSRVLTSVPYLRTLLWSPDGGWLAYHSLSWQEGRKIQQISANGTVKRTGQLSNDQATVVDFAYSPSGGKLWVIARSRSPDKAQILQLDADGGNERVMGEFRGNFTDITLLSEDVLLVVNDWAGYPALWQWDLSIRRWTQLSDQRVANPEQLQWNPVQRTVTFVAWLKEGGKTIMALPG